MKTENSTPDELDAIKREAALDIEAHAGHSRTLIGWDAIDGSDVYVEDITPDDDVLVDVNVPDEYVQLASSWHDGQSSMLYALASTGNLTVGTIRPNDDDDQPMSDRAWHLSLWQALECEIGAIVRKLDAFHDDVNTLADFGQFIDCTIAELAKAYGIEV